MNYSQRRSNPTKPRSHDVSSQMQTRDSGKACFVQVAGSLENYAAIELQELGCIIKQQVPRGLYISATDKALYRIVYESRLAQRLLYPILNFSCQTEDQLYQMAFRKIDWTALFGLYESFTIESNVSNSKLRHSLYAGQLVKDAICDQFRQATGRRPDFRPQDADLVLNLHIHQDRAQISLDLGGGSLHRRAYRSQAGAAPLQETLAAAIIRASGWKGEEVLVDPMCGSGTLLAEALMFYCRIPAAYLRKSNGLRFLPDYNAKLWTEVITEANMAIRPLPEGLIRGSDISEANLMISAENLANLPYGEDILLRVSDFRNLKDFQQRFIITNPPYGVRIGESDSIKSLYNDLGSWMRTECKNSTAVVLCGSAELTRELRLRHRWQKNLKNGDLDTVLAKFLLR